VDRTRFAELFERDLASLNASRRRFAVHLHPTEVLALYALLRMAERHGWCTGSLAEFAGELAARCERVAVPTIAVRAGIDLAFPPRRSERAAGGAKRWPASEAARSIYRERFPRVRFSSKGKVHPEDSPRLRRYHERQRRAISSAMQSGNAAGEHGWPAAANPYDSESEDILRFAWASGWKLGNAYYLRGLEREPLWP